MSQYVVLDQCLSLLRYVSEGDQVFHDDINKPVECLRALSSLFRYFRPDDPLVDELDNILNKIPYVKTGDLIMPDHHNLIVDALKKARDILSRMESYYLSQINSLLSIIDALSQLAGGIRITYFQTPAPLTYTFYFGLVTEFVNIAFEDTNLISDETHT
jgi:hypothetical protein